MTEQQINNLGPAFATYLERFRDSFVQDRTGKHIDTYCRGLLSDLLRKSAEPIALAPGFRTDFRESLYRMIGALTRTGVTIVTTVEATETFTELALSPYAISFLSDDIIRLRYVEIDGQLRKVLMVVKMRAGDHSKDIREYEVTAHGLRVGERLTGYRGLITGVPTPLDPGPHDPKA